MPIARIGYSTDFILKDQGVGIGTDTAGVKLEVGGTTKANYNITGIASLTNYAGFAAAEQNIVGIRTVTGEHSTLGDIVVGVGSVLHVSTGATVCTGSVESISITGHFSPPCGGVEDRQECPVKGTVRFNKDLNTLEFYNGVDWRQFTVSGQRGRGVYVGGSNYPVGPLSSTIDYIEIATQGNAQDFGNLTAAREGMGMGTISSAIRGLAMAGWTGSASDIIEYITLASGGNSIDFGNSTQARGWGAGMSSSTRGLCAGGYSPSTVNTIDYVEIMTLGDAVDFGDLPSVKESTVGMSSPTRGIVGTGMAPSFVKTIDYLTMASKGNALVFGDLESIRGLGAAANTTTGLFAGGKGPDQQNLNIIYKITIASTGSQSEFGTLSTGVRKPAGVSNSTRACFAGGENTPTPRITTIQSVSFSSGGTTEFFGDLTEARQAGNCSSDSHGGLGGY